MKDSTRRRLEALEQTVQAKKTDGLRIQIVFVNREGKQTDGPLFLEDGRVILPEDWEGPGYPGWIRREKGQHYE